MRLALIAQLVEQFPFKELVPRSSRGEGTNLAPYNQLFERRSPWPDDF